MSSTLFDLYYDKNISNLSILAEVAVIREDNTRSNELQDVIETEQVLSDIEGMLNEKVEYSVTIVDPMAKAAEKGHKKSKDNSTTDCSIGMYNIQSYIFAMN